MKYLIMCEGPNELEIIRMLLEHDKLIFTEDDLLNLVPYHARQIASNPTVKAALNLYHGKVRVLRIGDKLNDELKKFLVKKMWFTIEPVMITAQLSIVTITEIGLTYWWIRLNDISS